MSADQPSSSLNRRDFSIGALAATLTGCVLASDEGGASPEQPEGDRATGPSAGGRVAEPSAASEAVSEDRPLEIAMLLFPDLTALDLVGPQLIFATMLPVRVHLVWKSRDVVRSDSGLGLQPTGTLDECPEDLDVLFVPGGALGLPAVMNDPGVIDFLQDRGCRTRYVTSACNGSLLLAAAGLLRGYRAGCHWAYRDFLPLLGAEPVADRVVEDRNRITGGGVTAGIDLALHLSARLRGDDTAMRQTLAFEYAPEPPFDTGTPERAGAELTSAILGRLAPRLAAVHRAALEARERLPR